VYRKEESETVFLARTENRQLNKEDDGIYKAPREKETV